MEEYKKVLVVGLGYRTGLAVANFLVGKGASVTVSDNKTSSELSGVISKLDPSVRVLTGEQKPEILQQGFDALIVSPGVPVTIPLVAEAYRKQIPVLAEVELASRYLEGMMVAVTGTDGKSTTTACIGHIFKELGFDTAVGGNIGIPLITFVDRTTRDSVIVAELSSFQLETIARFRPDAALMLNIAPDHLDRYNGIEDYFKAKMRISMNQTKDDFFIYNMDDEFARKGASSVRSLPLSFSIENSGADLFVRGGAVYLKESGKIILPAGRLKIKGMHNLQNAMAAILAVRSIMQKKGIAPDYDGIAGAACTFAGLAHRLEPIGAYKGRDFINDSKATTVNAVLTALRSLSGKSVLILGGRTKGDDYARLASGMNGVIRGLVLIGESREYFSGLFKGYDPIEADSLDDAVVKAMRASREGDSVLLSPACASFDMFKNYEERGEEFRKSLNRLKSGELKWT
jgi:UDP-N-acetylmuramoylalanine--D-glutamate ligase